MCLQVMGLAVLGDYLYVVYHKWSTVYTYSRLAPYRPHSATNVDQLKWPRGMAASQKHQSIYVTDWSSMFAGQLWRISRNVTEVARSLLQLQIIFQQEMFVYVIMSYVSK